MENENLFTVVRPVLWSEIDTENAGVDLGSFLINPKWVPYLRRNGVELIHGVQKMAMILLAEWIRLQLSSSDQEAVSEFDKLQTSGACPASDQRPGSLRQVRDRMRVVSDQMRDAALELPKNIQHRDT